jgi:integrase/recombinase XerD
MTANRDATHRTPAHVLKSPLAAHSRGAAGSRVPVLAGTAAHGTRAEMSARAITLQDFADYLLTTNNRAGRPYEDATVHNYVYAGKALDQWMTAKGIEGDFTACDTAMLNLFLREYFTEHGQGGTHSQQRNMRHLFTYMQREFDHPHPYTDRLHQYQEPKGRRPATLSGDFIKDLLDVTGGGRARDFTSARDHAIIRVLTEGVRRSEVLGMTMSALRKTSSGTRPSGWCR